MNGIIVDVLIAMVVLLVICIIIFVLIVKPDKKNDKNKTKADITSTIRWQHSGGRNPNQTKYTEPPDLQQGVPGQFD